MKKNVTLLCLVMLSLFCITDLYANGSKSSNKNKKSTASTEDACNLQVAFEYEVDNLEVKFTNITNGTYDNVQWSFGDDKQSKSESPTHTYAKGGAYTFCLTATNTKKNCSEEFCGQLYVFDK